MKTSSPKSPKSSKGYSKEEFDSKLNTMLEKFGISVKRTLAGPEPVKKSLEIKMFQKKADQ